MGLSWGLLQLETCETVRHCHPCAIVAQASWVGGCWRRKVVALFFFGWWRWRTRNVCVFLGSHFFLTFLTRHFWWNPIFRFHHNLSDVSWEILRILEKFSRLPVLGSKPFLSSSARGIWIPAFRCSNPKVLSFLALNPSTQRQKSRVKVLNNVNPGSLTLGIPWLTKWWLTPH